MQTLLGHAPAWLVRPAEMSGAAMQAGLGNMPPKMNVFSETLARHELRLVPLTERAALRWPQSWKG